MPKCQVEITSTIVEPPVGFEPTTFALQVQHSTIKVKEAIKIIYIEILASRIKVTRSLKPYLASLLDKSVCIYLGHILPNILNLFSNFNI